MPTDAYYNEHDPFAAAWLRNLIMLDLIACGDVDERSIEDVRPDDLRGYGQCHFFAGIGVWSAALRGAGWPDDRPIWTGSCPCQPFSAAGKGGGFDDERHLWPAWHWLIRECRPDVVLGEQVASKPGLAWFDLVSADLEGEGYAVAPVDLCAAGVGAPHIRQRLWFVAHHHHQQSGQWRAGSLSGTQAAVGREDGSQHGHLADRPADGREDGSWPVADNDGQRQPGRPEPDIGALRSQFETPRRGDAGGRGDHGPVVHAPGEQAGLPRRAREPGGAGELGDADSQREDQVGGILGWSDAERTGSLERLGHHHQGLAQRPIEDVERGTVRQEGPTPGASGLLFDPWGDAEWIPCRDGKWRPVEPGTFPLAHGAPARVGRLRGYGNAIVKPVAEAFIEAVMAAMP